jgi:L-amino acid N-acyltransferase YncA
MTDWSGPLKIRSARVDDAKKIARIYNQGVQDIAATFENVYATLEERYLLLAALPDKSPVLVAEVKHTLMRWSALYPYSPRHCYDGVRELSIYSERSLRGQGVAQELMKAMPNIACEKGFYKIIGRIMPVNEGARNLCQLTGRRRGGMRSTANLARSGTI